jgi:hypothetical protein
MATTPTSATTSSCNYPLPYIAAMIGRKVYLQAYAIAPSQNQLGIIVSNGVEWRFGSN